jgi:hypothetical protein
VKDVADRVNQWARENAAIEWQYNAPYVWWGEALRAGIISDGEYERARDWYGSRWTYVGD